MRLDFNVLWVDDQPESVASQKKAIAESMQQQGFEFNATPCDSMDQVRERIRDHIFTDEVDLIVVDWDLGHGAQGQEAIAEIRESIRYKDVVFYSARTPPAKLKEFSINLEGIFCTAREGLVDEVVGVFDSLVKKVLDLDHVRGIVMGATTDIDNMVNESLTLMHGKLDKAGQEAMLKDAIKLAHERVEGLTTKLQEATTMARLFEAYELFPSYDRLRILVHTLDMQTFEAHKDARPAVTAYMGKVVPNRNILGHQPLTPKGKPKTVANNKGKQIGLDEMCELRRIILDLRGEFRKLHAALQAIH